MCATILSEVGQITTELFISLTKHLSFINTAGKQKKCSIEESFLNSQLLKHFHKKQFNVLSTLVLVFFYSTYELSTNMKIFAVPLIFGY